jgi:hypothetical protein
MFDLIIIGKGFNEFMDSPLEILSHTLKVALPESQDELQFASLRKGTIVEVTIREDTGETVAASESR